MELVINGQQVVAEKGETVLQCALRHGIEIPHLCTHPSLPPFGACRMCLVEIEGMRGFPTSCTTPAAAGMIVHTNTPALQELRRNTLALMMIEHPSGCLVCGKRELCDQFRPAAEKVGSTTGCHTCNNKEVCEVRGLAAELGFCQLPVPPMYHQRPIERNNPFIDRDLNLCILCGRCVRICKHQHGVSVIDFVGRSSATKIGEAFDRSLMEAGCRFCGSCVDVCPTGTLSDRYAKWYGKPDSATETTCIFCEAACALTGQAAAGKLVSAQAVNESVPVCVLGRFALPEFLNGPDRLQMPHVRVGKVLREHEWEAAFAAAAEKLKPYTGSAFAFVCDTTSTLEDRLVFRKFTREVMQSDYFIELTPDARGEVSATLPDGVKAAIFTGAFVAPEAAAGLEVLVVQDCYPTPLSARADAVLPAAVFAEAEGTVTDGTGALRPLRKACSPPGQARPEWEIVCGLARAMGAAGFMYESAREIALESGIGEAALWIAREAAPAAASDPKVRRTHFRGHDIADKVSGLKALPVNGAVPVPEIEAEEAPRAAGKFEILEKREIVPNNHEIVIHAPHIAKKAKAGQFVIVMADANSERVPYTLCDWDIERGTITLIVQEKGQSSRKLVLKSAGDSLAHVVGPLGIPLDIQHYGTVALAGGCYGIGGIVPVARAMKEAGNHVIAVVEARSHYLAYYSEKLEGIADEFMQTTIDGSYSFRGHAVDYIAKMFEEGRKLDCVVAIGCPFMMMLTSQETKPHGVKTFVALNPIMLDGTGMCGACRVTVGEDTKFACVDGPFFDGHLVDWEEVRDRRAAYSAAEIQSVGRTAPVTHEHHHHHAGQHACSCRQ